MIKQVICGLLLLGSFGVGLFGAESPFVGTWKLNVAKSKFAKGREIKELTVVVKTEGNTRVVSATGIDGTGKPTSVKYSVAIGGGAIGYTEGAPPAGTTVVGKVVDEHTNDQIATMNGKQVYTIHTVASANGKTLTQTRTAVDAQGKTSKSMLIYNRQ